MDGKVYNRIKVWLSGTKQRVQINGKKSNRNTVNSGVHQGFTEPITFHYLYKSPEPWISSNISKFEDNTKIGELIDQ